MIIGSDHQEDIAINVYMPNSRASKYVKQNLTESKGNLGKPVIIIILYNCNTFI